MRTPTRTSASTKKTVWIKTLEKECITTALECGLSDTILIDSNDANAAANLPTWRQLGRINVVTAHPEGNLIDDAGSSVGRIERLLDASDLSSAMDAAASADGNTNNGYVIMDASDWQIIPAENLVAAFQSLPGTLLAVAKTAADSQVMLEALEIGTDGIVLQTSDPGEIRALASFLQSRDAQGQKLLGYEIARVKEVRPVGSGDRVCVDLCTNMIPGEGLLVGSFARGMFLVHSECEESGYINSRPFRVNAGPVHAYVQIPDGKTGYLAELRSGVEVEVVDALGHHRRELVGRVKIERRPLVLIDATTPDGESHSILLQNAETVKLVGPVDAQPSSTSASSTSGSEGNKSSTGDQVQGGKGDWKAISVSQLSAGDLVYVLVQEGARHTGISIEESISER